MPRIVRKITESKPTPEIITLDGEHGQPFRDQVLPHLDLKTLGSLAAVNREMRGLTQRDEFGPVWRDAFNAALPRGLPQIAATVVGTAGIRRPVSKSEILDRCRTYAAAQKNVRANRPLSVHSFENGAGLVFEPAGSKTLATVWNRDFQFAEIHDGGLANNFFTSRYDIDAPAAWSPDGQYLAARVARSSQLTIETAASGLRALLVETPERPREIAWSPDSSRLVTLDGACHVTLTLLAESHSESEGRSWSLRRPGPRSKWRVSWTSDGAYLAAHNGGAASVYDRAGVHLLDVQRGYTFSWISAKPGLFLQEVYGATEICDVRDSADRERVLEVFPDAGDLRLLNKPYSADAAFLAIMVRRNAGMVLRDLRKDPAADHTFFPSKQITKQAWGPEARPHRCAVTLYDHTVALVDAEQDPPKSDVVSEP